MGIYNRFSKKAHQLTKSGRLLTAREINKRMEVYRKKSYQYIAWSEKVKTERGTWVSPLKPLPYSWIFIDRVALALDELKGFYIETRLLMLELKKEAVSRKGVA